MRSATGGTATAVAGSSSTLPADVASELDALRSAHQEDQAALAKMRAVAQKQKDKIQELKHKVSGPYQTT